MGNDIRRDGFKKITGTKIHVAVEQNGLPISITMGSANIHDSTKLADVIENISDFVDGEGNYFSLCRQRL